MASRSQTTVVPTDAQLLTAQDDLWRHSLYYLTSMALKCAVELGIPTSIHNLGGATNLPDLVDASSLPRNKLPFLRRLMHLLVTSGIFASGGDNNSAEETFCLNPLSWLLVEGVDSEDHTYQKYFVLGTVSRHYVDASLTLADWFKKDLSPPLPCPFEELHGVSILHEKTAQFDEELDTIVKEGVPAHDNLAMRTVIRECSQIFNGLQSLTDCSGGNGTTAREIMKAYPHIKCNVLDQQRVIDTAPTDGAAADMFKFIPPAQAVLLELVLHFWNDEDCVKILEQCPKALPSREEGGKVVIIDTVLRHSLGPIIYEAQLLLDMPMLVNTRGRQRDENDMRDIFTKAGFSDYKIVKKIGARAIIEVYP